MTYWNNKRAMVVGGSAGLGRAVSKTLLQQGARVAVVARGQEQLDATVDKLKGFGEVVAMPADITRQADVEQLVAKIEGEWDGVDILCQCAGVSMRGTALGTSTDEYQKLWELNFLATVRCVQAFAKSLSASRGHAVLIGSLASKVASRYLGAYPASKFPLAAFAQQLRIENGNDSFHTLLVCPGPIARDDSSTSGSRYSEQASGLPQEAHRPGGGAKTRAIDSNDLAARILKACEARKAELVVPGSARLLFAISQLSPAVGDWLLRKMTSD
jgi:short-subunit dehydrogenase